MRSAAAIGLFLTGCAAAPAVGSLAADNRPTSAQAPNAPQEGRRIDARVERSLDWAEAELRPSFAFETLIGSRSVGDDDAWDPIDAQLDLAIGVQTPLLGRRSLYLDQATDWLGWDLGLGYARDRSERTSQFLEGEFVDLSLGLFLEPPDPGLILRPYVGAGWNGTFTSITREANGTRERERDVVGGPYVRGGLRFYWEPRRFFGFDVRWRSGDDGNPVDLINAPFEATTISFVAGAAF